MHDWPIPESDEIPTPKLVAAWVTLDIIPTERIPLWAAHWLVQGYDGDTLRTLAGLSGTDPHDVHDALPAALADCAAPIPDSDAAAAQVAFIKLARMHADNRATERWVLDKVCEIVAGPATPTASSNYHSARYSICQTSGEQAGAGRSNKSNSRSGTHAELNSPPARRPTTTDPRHHRAARS